MCSDAHARAHVRKYVHLRSWCAETARSAQGFRRVEKARWSRGGRVRTSIPAAGLEALAGAVVMEHRHHSRLAEVLTHHEEPVQAGHLGSPTQNYREEGPGGELLGVAGECLAKGSPLQCFICQTHFFSVFLSENQRFEGMSRMVHRHVLSVDRACCASRCGAVAQSLHGCFASNDCADMHRTATKL